MTKQRPSGIIPQYQFSQSSFPSEILVVSSLLRRRGAIVNATIDVSLMRMFKAGPEVSLKGSPTVSPTTHALPWSVFLIFSFSHSFLLLSQAPPALLIKIASMQPVTRAPASTPIRHLGPTVKPTVIGTKI